MEEQISSPTFTIVNEYSDENEKIYHFDVYRLSDLEEFYDIKRSKIFYENKGKIFDVENNEIIGWSINGSPIKSER